MDTGNRQGESKVPRKEKPLKLRSEGTVDSIELNISFHR